MDEAALKSCLGTKGASGRKICHFCANVFGRQAGDAANLTCLSSCKVSVSDEHIFEVMELLRSRKPVDAKAKFSELETALGWTYHTAA